MELNDPVVDEKNYVYEKDAILHHIRIKGGSVKAPTAGACRATVVTHSFADKCEQS